MLNIVIINTAFHDATIDPTLSCPMRQHDGNLNMFIFNRINIELICWLNFRRLCTESIFVRLRPWFSSSTRCQQSRLVPLGTNVENLSNFNDKSIKRSLRYAGSLVLGAAHCKKHARISACHGIQWKPPRKRGRHWNWWFKLITDVYRIGSDSVFWS